MKGKEKSKQRNMKRNSLVQLLLGVVIILLVNIIGSFVFTRFDLTSEKRYSLSPATKELLKKIDPRTGQVTEAHPSFLKTGDAAWVRMEPLHPIAVETFLEFPELGRFAVRDMGTTVAAGVIKEVTKKGP